MWDALLLDFFFFFSCYLMVIYSKMNICLLMYFMFYSIRAIFLNLCDFPEPEIYSFWKPYFPSWVVSYTKSNDLYFSGHAGSTFCMFIYSTYKKYIPISHFFLFLYIYTITILLVEGIHYSNDIIIGSLYGYFCARVISLFQRNIENWCISQYAKNMDKFLWFFKIRRVSKIESFDDLKITKIWNF